MRGKGLGWMAAGAFLIANVLVVAWVLTMAPPAAQSGAAAPVTAKAPSAKARHLAVQQAAQQGAAQGIAARERATRENDAALGVVVFGAAGIGMFAHGWRKRRRGQGAGGNRIYKGVAGWAWNRMAYSARQRRQPTKPM